MSIQMNQYLVYGYMVPCKEAQKVLESKFGDQVDEFHDKYYDSAFETKIVEINSCSFISYVGEKYHFFGKVFNKSDNHEPLATTNIPKVSSKIKKQVEEEFKNVFGDEFQVEPSLILLTHYR